MVGNNRGTAVPAFIAGCLLAAFLLAGCSGNNADPAERLDPAMPGQTAADSAAVPATQNDESPVAPVAAGLPTGLPVDEYVDPALIAARRGNALGEYTLAGADYHLASGNATATEDALVLDAGDGSISWAMYCFEENTAADAPFVFALELKQYIHAPVQVGIADYESGAWHWLSTDKPGPVNYFGTPGYLEPVNPGGNLYVIVIVKAGGYAVIDGLAIYRESAAPPPVGLTTGLDGIHPDRINLSWEGLAVTYPGLIYESIAIERLVTDEEWTEIARVPAGTSTYEDTTTGESALPFGEEVSYRLRTVTTGESGVACPAATGICRLESVAHLSATNITYPDLIRLLWDPVPDADGYLIEIHYEDEWQTLAELATGDADVYEHVPGGVSGLDPAFNIDYEYRIRATWREHLSPEYASATGSRGLARVYHLNASKASYPDKTSVSWSYVENATGYHIGYREGDGEIQLLDTVSDLYNTSYYHTNISPPGKECAYNVEYTYYASAEFNGEVMPWDKTTFNTGYRAVQAPDSIRASDGEFGEFIRFRWSPQYGSDNMRIFRDGTNPEHLVAELGYVWEWDDYVGDLAEHTYYVQSSWQGIWSDLSEPDTGYRNLFKFHHIGETYIRHLDLEIVDGTPAIALYASSDGVRFLHSSVLEPTDEDDWSSHLVIETDDECLVSMAVVDGQPAMAVNGRSSPGDGVRYARATTTSPESEIDWQIHSIAEGDDVAGTISLQEVNGVPALCYPSPEYKYARATGLYPATLDDWVICHLPSQNYQPSLIEYQGRPALITFSEPGYTSSIKLLIGNLAEPATSDDWQFHSIGTGYAASVIAEINGNLAVGFNNHESLFAFGQAAVGTPQTPEDWQFHLLGEYGDNYRNSSESLVEYQGRPVLLYHIPGSLMLARATVAQPLDAGDWQIDRVGSSRGGHDLLVINGKLAVAFCNSNSGYYGIAQE